MNRCRLTDGRTFSWREAGAGPPLVLLHGWAMSSAVFAEVTDALCGSFRVLAPDLRGHGGSDAGPGYALDDFAADLGEWFALLDLEQVALLGWSLGGMAALRLAELRPERIARLLLVSTTPRFIAGEGWAHGLPDPQVRTMSRDLKRRYEKTMEDFFALQFAGEELPRDRYRQIVGFAVRQGRLPEPEAAQSGLETLRREDLRGRLAGIDRPALVLHGELDRIIPWGAGDYLARRLPQGAFGLLPAVGHAPFLSRPDLVLGRIREFLP